MLPLPRASIGCHYHHGTTVSCHHHHGTIVSCHYHLGTIVECHQRRRSTSGHYWRDQR